MEGRKGAGLVGGRAWCWRNGVRRDLSEESERGVGKTSRGLVMQGEHFALA